MVVVSVHPQVSQLGERSPVTDSPLSMDLGDVPKKGFVVRYPPNLHLFCVILNRNNSGHLY